MDFGSILHKAQRNDQTTTKKQIQYYSTKFEPPKKEQRNKTLSANIQKFLAKRDEEERKKQVEAESRKHKLLELRAKDKKACKRVNVMLKRTKSANQSVMGDAGTNSKQFVTQQPDEDDYGYVSAVSQDFYNKLMEKYSKMPVEEDKFGASKKTGNVNLKAIKDRVKSGLLEDNDHTGGRKRTKSDKGNHSIVEESKVDQVVEKEKKVKLKPAPVINFNDLLKLAEKKQHEPIVIEPKVKCENEQRPLTKKQKRELEKERDSRERRKEREKQQHQQDNNKPTPPTATPTSNSNNKSITRIPPSNKQPASSSTNPASNSSSSLNQKSVINKQKVPINNYNTTNNHIGGSNKKALIASNQNNVNKKVIRNGVTSSGGAPTSKPSASAAHMSNKPNNSNPNAMMRQRPQQQQMMKPKEFPPRDLMRSRPPQRKMLSPDKRRRILDDDDYACDSEMDDFIDDGVEEGEDYSKYISEIFGYDKRRYRYEDEDEDDANMESSFAQQQREEQISRKIGIMEDLEDMRQEEEEKRRKAEKMKKIRKK